MKRISFDECHQISGGSFVIPFIAAGAVGTAVGLLVWSIDMAAEDRYDEFSSAKNYAVQGGSGAIIGLIASAVFVAAV